jgi:hypothetical protein
MKPVRVLKEEEVRLYGDEPRRTSRLVLDAWDKLVTGQRDCQAQRYVILFAIKV